MSDQVKQHPYQAAVEAFASELARLDSATAHAIAAEAQVIIRAALLRQEIEQGRNSGAPLDGEAVFAELLAEPDADIIAATRS